MKTIKITSWISLFVGLVSLLFIWFGEPNKVASLTREDGLIENFSALFYLIGFVISVISIIKVRPVYLPIIWTVLCFFFLGEETSWFQRYFKYSVPAIEEINSQNEFNFHNLEFFQGGSLIDSSSRFNPNVLMKSQNLFRMGFFLYFLILPLLVNFPKIKRLVANIGYEKPDNSFTLIILSVVFLSFILAINTPSILVKEALAETREMFYSFFIMIYILTYIWCIENTDFGMKNDK